MLRSISTNAGHVLLVALMLIMATSLLGLTSLFLAGQDVPGVTAIKEETIARDLADAAAELVVAWFHDPAVTPSGLTEVLSKRQGDVLTGPSYFDSARRSQFVGTADRPDILLDSAKTSDYQVLNGAPSGLPESLRENGRLDRVKIYAPEVPGLLGTLEVSATSGSRKPVTRTVKLQLGALSIPSVRAALQAGKSLGSLPPGRESSIRVHWGDQRIMGDLVARSLDDIVTKSGAAPVTGQPYDPNSPLSDRWAEYWIGGEVTVTLPPPGQSIHPILPSNVHIRQIPVPGLHVDAWEYESLKKVALRYGTYFRADSNGLLHSSDAPEGDSGSPPGDVLFSRTAGDHRGIIFIDTTDGTPPRTDNLAKIVVETDYLEAILVVQGHVTLKPNGPGRSLATLTPPVEGTNSQGTRIPVQLSGIHMNGLVWAAGAITIEKPVRVFGAIMAGGDIIVDAAGTTMEVWYNSDFARGHFPGLPIVYRAPGSWSVF
ncbi:hypothetical protein [Nitrospira sp. KM1]|uniref:hypothetical protein n=1 Tax=Nitrospira sp. KM1 TaxID=1936990 RepID=UPI001566A52A|nr:hypothetical protein [Nitrospira sp. KM1]